MILFVILSILVALYYYGTKNYNYWTDRNVKHHKPIPFFGNNFKQYIRRANYTEIATTLYQEYPNEQIVGYYRGMTPEVIVRDPQIIRHIMTTDFNYFYARGLGRDPEVEPMLANLFHVDGDLWKMLRQRLTPAFTTGKLKNMFHLIVECAEEMQQVAGQISESGKPYNMRELMARFTTDFIGACGFGIKMNSLNNSKSEFRDLGRLMFTTKFSVTWRMCLKEIFPSLFKNVKPFQQVIENAIINLVKSIMEQRNYKPVGRNDFIDLMLELKSKGKIVADSIEKVGPDGCPVIVERDFDLMLMSAQAFVFFAAGFETSSSATSYTLHELAYNPDVQTKVHQEIDKVLANYDNKLCYDAIKDMSYLECTFNEGLRKFPSLGVLNRVCTRKYQIPSTNVCIDKGVKVIIPIAAIQNDEKYYENANEFNPSRFLKDMKDSAHKFTFLPFGDGPRACIGNRLGMMQSMTGLAALLQHFRVEPAPGSKREIELDHSTLFIQNVQGGLPLLLRKRVSNQPIA